MKFSIVVIAIIISQIQAATVNLPYAKEGYLNCTSVTNPTWYLKNTTAGTVTVITTGGKFTVDGSVLKITDLRSPELTAEYFCNGTGGSQSFEPSPEPYMFAREKASITVTEGGMTAIQCKMIVGYQQNQTVAWSWKLKGVEVSGDRFTIANSGPNNQTSELTFRKVALDDKGSITCTVINPAGNYTQEIQLRVKNTLAALWPFLAIVGEVIILCIIILIFEKKCAKKNTTSEDEAENLMKQKETNNSDLKKRSVKA